jgi:phage gp29-like protein
MTHDTTAHAEASERRSESPAVPEQIATGLAAPAGKAMAALLGQIEEMMKGAGSLAEFREMLLAAYPDLDDGPLADALADALTMAETSGRLDVAEEI